MFSKPKKLYKYLSKEGAQALFTNPNPSIWFRLANKLNDVYDLNPVGSNATDFGDVGIFCLSETPISAPMWAHYGSSGEGVVLEFSSEASFFEKFPPCKVRYSKRRPNVKNVIKAMTSKSNEWSYECEWRCFATPHRADVDGSELLVHEQAVSIQFPFEALTSIIHGYDGQVDTEEFLAREELQHVKELVCRVDPWKFGFNLREIADINYIFEQQEAMRWGWRVRK